MSIVSLLPSSKSSGHEEETTDSIWNCANVVRSPPVPSSQTTAALVPPVWWYSRATRCSLAVGSLSSEERRTKRKYLWPGSAGLGNGRLTSWVPILFSEIPMVSCLMYQIVPARSTHL